MENSRLKTRILKEMERLIVRSSGKQKVSKKGQGFHEAIIKKHYNASDVAIDYHRHRIKMNVVVDDQAYDPNAANVNLEVLPVNLFFKNLGDFLRSCLEYDPKSLAFYAKLVQENSNTNTLQPA